MNPAQKYSAPVLKKNVPDDSGKFLPLPKPTGPFPFHLDVQDIRKLGSQNKLVFHMLGDTGGLRSADFQREVVSEMVRQYQQPDEHGKPQFLYHLGDIVYNHGEWEEYERQFFEPFQHYPAPIFAIPGNHDADVNPDNPAVYSSLDAFRAVFCDSSPRTVTFSGNAERKSMVQPNLYWSLITPVARIIGLYGNVTKFGKIEAEQRRWLVAELQAANRERKEKAVVLCVHHAPYSADINHGSSLEMIRFLEGVFAETGIVPDVVFSGHVHNYQRFAKDYPGGKTVPYIVAGGGGYDELHPVASLTDNRFSADNPLLDGVRLVNYCDRRHGFLKISIEKEAGGVTLKGAFYTIPEDENTGRGASVKLADEFVINL